MRFLPRFIANPLVRLRHSFQPQVEQGIAVTRARRAIIETMPPALGLLVACTALLTTDGHDTGTVAPLFVVAGLLVVGMLVASFVDARTARWTIPLGAGYVMYIVVLRHLAGGAFSGYASLTVLGVWWIGLRGSRAQLWAAIALLTIALSAPIILLGSPDYPPREWVRAIAVLAVAIGVGSSFASLIGRLEDANKALLELANKDPLTGLPNRRALEQVAQLERRRADRSETPIFAAMVDLDHFKRYNDSRGHAAGDELLATVAQRWSTKLRAGDIVARLGGEEFAFLICTAQDQVGARAILDRACAEIPFDQTCSAGLVEWSAESTFDNALAAADKLLYLAKDRGRNQVAVA